MSKNEIENFLSNVTTAFLDNDQVNLFEEDLSETDLHNSMKNMQNTFAFMQNTFIGNDRVSKEFYESFWDEIKDVFINLVMEVQLKCSL